MTTQSLPIAGKLSIKTLVAKQLPTNNITIYTDTCKNGKSIPHTHESISKYNDTLHTESDVYDVNYQEKQV